MTPRFTRPGRWLTALAASLVLTVAGCASPQPQDYAAEQPTLDLREFFNGEMVAHGLFTDRSGRVKRRFEVKLKGTWTGDSGVLEEDFVYSDGAKERRVWRLTRGADGRYTGRADDVVGTALGEAAGNALRWRYTLRLQVDGSSYDVQFDDWMFLMDRHVMLNRAAMSKFGVHLGDVTLSFYKP
jgi:Protein of unknown function (DUF3833)